MPSPQQQNPALPDTCVVTDTWPLRSVNSHGPQASLHRHSLLRGDRRSSMYTWCTSYRMHATTHTHTHTHTANNRNDEAVTPRRIRDDKTIKHHAACSTTIVERVFATGRERCAARSCLAARFLKCVLLSRQLSSTPCSVARSTLAPAARMQHPHCRNRREVLRCSGGVARKDSCTACERTAFIPCHRTHSAIDTRRRKEEPTSAWPNRCQPVAHSALQPPSTPPASMRAC